MKFYLLVFGGVLSAAISSQSAGFARPARIPTLVSVRAADRHATENPNNTIRFVLRRGLNTHSPLIVSYRLGGTAANGVDYDELSGSVQFAAGESTAVVLVRPIDDSIVEGSERVTLRLVRPASFDRAAPYRIAGPGSATAVIRDNDTVLPEEIVLAPAAAGTVGRFMELQDPDIVREGNLQSFYFRTTEQNREFRRAFLEFEIPALPRGILSATLMIADGSATATQPVPPDRHELSAYPADLAVTVSDYDQSTIEVTTFETDFNVHGETFELDVTEVVRTFNGQNLGLRIKLAVDPVYSEIGSLGAGFQELSQGRPPRLVIKPRN